MDIVYHGRAHSRLLFCAVSLEHAGGNAKPARNVLLAILSGFRYKNEQRKV